MGYSSLAHTLQTTLNTCSHTKPQKAAPTNIRPKDRILEVNGLSSEVPGPRTGSECAPMQIVDFSLIVRWKLTEWLDKSAKSRFVQIQFDLRFPVHLYGWIVVSKGV